MSLVWNILDKIFFQTEGSQRKDRKHCPSSGLHPCASFKGSAGIVVWRSVLTLRIRLVGQRPFLMMKIIKTIAISWLFEYTICNRVARSLFGIGDQAETCAQLFYVKE